MKTLIISLLFFVGTTSFPALGQVQNYKHIAHNGEVKDARGVTIGMITKDQMINDANGKKIAFVDGQGNLVDAKTGKKMGRMGKDNKTFSDANGHLMYTLKDKSDQTCDIFDAKGKKIGNVHSSLKGSACALACFEEKHQNKS